MQIDADLWGETIWSGNMLTTCAEVIGVTRRSVMVRLHGIWCGDGDKMPQWLVRDLLVGGGGVLDCSWDDCGASIVDEDVAMVGLRVRQIDC